MYRLWSQFHSYWTKARPAEAPLLPRVTEFIHQEVTEVLSEDEGILFLCYMPERCYFVSTLYARMLLFCFYVICQKGVILLLCYMHFVYSVDEELETLTENDGSSDTEPEPSTNGDAADGASAELQYDHLHQVLLRITYSQKLHYVKKRMPLVMLEQTSKTNV